MTKKILKGFGLFAGLSWFLTGIGVLIDGKEKFFLPFSLILIGLTVSYFCLPSNFKARLKNSINRNSKQDDSGFKYPSLIKIEKTIQKAINNKKSFDLPLLNITKEEFDYLHKKYPQVDVPITHEWNRFHEVYKKQFEKLRGKIEAGEKVCLSENEENLINEFVIKYLPNTKLNVTRPSVYTAFIAGLKYHDYKRNAVREMLEYEEYHFKYLDLEPEPENLYDPYAVKIIWENYHLGYVPEQYSKEVFKAIEEGREVDCLLENYFKYGNVNDRAKIKLTIEN